MSDLQKGYSFSGTSPNNSVTAEKLNTLVDGATIVPGFYLEKAELSAAANDDVLLLFDTSAGGYRRIQKQNLVSAATAKTGFTNLTVQCVDGVTVTLTAEEAVLRNDSGGARRVTSLVSSALLTAYVSRPTPGGRDFATVVNNTWIYVWVISDGVNERVLLSTSVSAPTMPTSSPMYQYRALAGAARVNASGALVKFAQRGNAVALQPGSVAGVAEANLNPRTGGVEFTAVGPVLAREFQTVDLTRCVPPEIVARVQGVIGSSSTATGNCTYAVASYGLGSVNNPTVALGLQVAHTLGMATATGGWFNAATFDVPLRTAQQVDWACSSTAAHHSLRVTGFTLAL